MHEDRIAFATPANATTWKRRLVFSPVARIVLFVLLFVACTMVLGIVAGVAGVDRHALSPVWQLVFRAVAPLAAYLLLVKLVERRPVSELSLRRLAPEGALGLLAGAVLFSAVVGVLWLLGSYHVVGTNPDAQWSAAVLVVILVVLS